MTMLEVRDLHTYYGNIHALKGISLTVEEGEIVTLIGGNGAGKSTTLRTICGAIKPRQGSVRLNGEDLAGFKAHQVVYKGVSMVPEGRGVFARLTVAENLDLGAYTRSDRAGITQDLQRVLPGVSTAQGTFTPGRGYAFWRRATDAGHRPCADGAPTPSLVG